MSDVSADRPDWLRERPRKFWDPSRRLLRAIRKYQAIGDAGFLSLFTKKYWVLSHRFWPVITGAEIDLNSQIGGGLLIPHPNGIVIHPNVVIGPNCLIFQQVTLGDADGGVPTVGGHVDIGAGAKILGDITLGDHSRVGANAVVTKDVAKGDTVVGIPAKSVKDKENGP